MPPSKRKAAPDGLQAPEAPEAPQATVALLSRPQTILDHAVALAKTALLVALLAASATVSQLALSPVYGSIPPQQWHVPALAAACFIGWAAHRPLTQILPLPAAKLLPLVALCIPAAQSYLFRLSQTLGPRCGPLLTEGLTLAPLAALTASYIAASATPRAPGFLAPLLSWAALRSVRTLSAAHVATRIGSSFRYTRVGMQLCLAGSYALFAPSGWILLTLPALLHTALVNPHVATYTGTTALNGSMKADGWMLLERRESLTGYVSVTQNVDDMARVMRVDHSLLGGDWVDFRGANVTEPVYSVFVMLEAVRLVERETPLSDADASALVIGLGIGTLPSAFVAHGIPTTVVEIDPAVYAFALKYFQLRENQPPVIDDAVSYTARLAAHGNRTFDYIVHDVFTGGAEPVELFTLEFFQTLDALLRDDGVIAINYAGDLVLPTPKIILRTILSVFSNCRIFRENPRDAEFFARTGSDFTNLLIFCHKTKTKTETDRRPLETHHENDDENEKFTFREPTRGDMLASRARHAYLVPRHEVSPADFLGDADDGLGLLRRGQEGRVLEWHRRSAEGHWWIMRSILKPSFWEHW